MNSLHDSMSLLRVHHILMLKVGKWHCGMSSREMLPVNRGFHSSFGFLSGAEDHFSNMRSGYTDLWRDNAPAYGENNRTYSTYMYTAEALRVLRPYGEASAARRRFMPPLFLLLAYQATHTPLQVPQNWTTLFPHVDHLGRRQFHAMTAALDASVGTVVKALREYEMFDDSLIIFASDNGGGRDIGNNWPLRGGKNSDFEGGVRALAILNGGRMPSGARGQVLREGIFHVADWFVP